MSQDIRVENLKCKIEGGEDQCISLFGSCIENVAEQTVLQFESHVREEDIKEISIANPSNHTWYLKPVIENEFWSGNDTLTVPANGSSKYAIKFQPTSMSSKGTKFEQKTMRI